MVMDNNKPVSVYRESVYTIECPCGNNFKEDGMPDGDPPDEAECGECGLVLDLSGLMEVEPGLGVPGR